ncbi:MAG: hypothetical protein E2P00_02800 [Acidobacteria bacterium]|nr:MAG: hypothetical protein E2P03_00920 [Acidobacteriota bacterium]TDI46021.1 MAG: hypothetical protein E2P00_02800 [Acidobacteriota bacterium]
MAQQDPSGIRGPVCTGLRAVALDRLLARSDDPEAVNWRDLQLGDTVIVRTRNSTYAMRALGRNHFAVSGGWFELHGGSPQVTRVNGCTWGGSAIRCDLVASPGLFLEFANGVKTTRISSVNVVRAPVSETTH